MSIVLTDMSYHPAMLFASASQIYHRNRTYKNIITPYSGNLLIGMLIGMFLWQAIHSLYEDTKEATLLVLGVVNTSVGILLLLVGILRKNNIYLKINQEEAGRNLARRFQLVP